MKSSEVFRKAKELIINEECKYICHAIKKVYIDNNLKAADKQDCWGDFPTKETTLIMKRLNTSYTLEGWLIQNKHMKGLHESGKKPAKLRKTRIAWLNSLITEHKDKGK